MIIPVGVSLLAVAAFGWVLYRTDIATVVRLAADRSSAGIGTMLDPQLGDEAKEAAVRAAGLSLLASVWQIFWRFALALAAAAAPLVLADAVGLTTVDTVVDLMLRVDYLVIVSVAAILLVALVRRVRKPSAEIAAPASQGTYGSADRFFHYLAFSSPAVLKAASRMEDRLVSAAPPAPRHPPIFVTSLARAGTTALLNALSEVPAIATHTYRDMPFLTAPVLWNRLSGGGKRSVASQQRAHGDGLEINLDSPEAFEEVLWKLFWPGKYTGGRIALWREADADPVAERFIARHMGKIIAARQAPCGLRAEKPDRYCSKNNANIARLAYLPQAFPGCRVVIPVRRPESHAASLLRQHRNFSRLQRQDDFVRRYMRDIGHHEFGLIYQPITFAGFEPTRFDPDTPDHWLHYWTCAMREIAGAQGALIVTQDDLRASPQATMSALCEALDLDVAAVDFAGNFRPGPDAAPLDPYDPGLLADAQEVYTQLSERAIGHQPARSRGAA